MDHRQREDNDVVIRPVEPDDQSEWLRMRRALWPEVEESMHKLEMPILTGDPAEQSVLVVDNGTNQLGGFIELSIRPRVDGSYSERVAYVEGWFVDEAHRGQGIGRRLMHAAEAWARERELTELASDTELHNEDGVRAHRALGFRETFRLIHFLKPVEDSTAGE